MCIRDSLPERTPSHPLQPDVAEREAVPAPHQDRRDRPEPVSYTHLRYQLMQVDKERVIMACNIIINDLIGRLYRYDYRLSLIHI